MDCSNCPYITDELENQIEECWCDKLGERIGTFDCCCEEDEEGEMSRKSYRREREMNSYKRDVKYKERMKKLAKVCEDRWYAPVYPVSSDGHYIDNLEDMAYVKRVWRGSRSKYLKQQSNKKLRQYKGDVPNCSGYKKVFDFWWELY